MLRIALVILFVAFPTVAVAQPASADGAQLAQSALAGVSASLESVDTCVTVLRQEYWQEPAFEEELIALSIGDKPRDMFVQPSPVREIRCWEKGPAFRIEVHGVLADGSTRLEYCYMSDGEKAAYYTTRLPAGREGVYGRVVELTQLNDMIGFPRWRDFYQTKLGALGRVQQTTAEAGAASGMIDIVGSSSRSRTVATVDSSKGFIPVAMQYYVDDELTVSRSADGIYEQDGIHVPAMTTTFTYHNGALVSSSIVEVVSARFNVPLEDSVFEIEFPEDARIAHRSKLQK